MILLSYHWVRRKLICYCIINYHQFHAYKYEIGRSVYKPAITDISWTCYIICTCLYYVIVSYYTAYVLYFCYFGNCNLPSSIFSHLRIQRNKIQLTEHDFISTSSIKYWNEIYPTMIHITLKYMSYQTPEFNLGIFHNQLIN